MSRVTAPSRRSPAASPIPRGSRSTRRATSTSRSPRSTASSASRCGKHHSLLPADLYLDLGVLRALAFDIDDAHGLIRSLQQKVVIAEGHELAPRLRHGVLVLGDRGLSVRRVGADRHPYPGLGNPWANRYH